MPRRLRGSFGDSGFFGLIFALCGLTVVLRSMWLRQLQPSALSARVYGRDDGYGRPFGSVEVDDESGLRRLPFKAGTAPRGRVARLGRGVPECSWSHSTDSRGSCARLWGEIAVWWGVAGVGWARGWFFGTIKGLCRRLLMLC